jgi:outer membrane protein OmpA-like peptidoglycan-associated protein
MSFQKASKSGYCTAALLLASVMARSIVLAETEEVAPTYSPAVNEQGLKGLSTITSAESMGAGRITFGLMVPWYNQHIGYLTSPNAGANIYVGTAAFSYGINSYVDLFANVGVFGGNNYTNTDKNYGLGTLSAGVQGRLPLQTSFLNIAGQTTLIGGTSQKQINTYRADGYNYFETRRGWDVMGKLMQTIQTGDEDWGIKWHLNEAGVVNINTNDPSLLLLGTGLQGNLRFIVLGAEINSRTRFESLAFSTDPLWVTPSIHIRTPWQMNVMAGTDISLSGARSDNNPRALDPYRVFGAVAFSFDMLAGKRHAEFLRRQKAEQEKVALQNRAAQSEKDLAAKGTNDSIALANMRHSNRMQMDSMQRKAYDDSVANKAKTDAMATKTTADSLALLQSANDLAYEKGKRSDAEKQLLSTGGLLLDAVYFETGKTIISINSKPYLNIIGKMLLKYPKLQIEVAGHTDNIGGADYNMGLSQGRSESVRNYMVTVYPALGPTLTAHGYGMSMPKADNGSKDGRQTNRRVELRVINRDALLEYSQK